VLKDNTMDGIIHTASPFHMNFSDPQELLGPAIHGTEGLLNAIVKLAPRVKRVVITSSFAAIVNPEKGNWPGHVYSEEDWNPMTMEQALHGDKMTTYRASKTFAERTAWDFVEEHKPGFDLVTLCPPMVYGPIINVQNLSSINTSNERMWKFLNGEVKTIEPMTTGHPLWVDVRDLASAHLSAYETQAAGGKRFFIVADELYSNQDIADAFRKVLPPTLLLATSSDPFQHFPELKDKIPEGEPGKGFTAEAGSFYSQNNARSKEILHLTYRTFESCMAGTLAPTAQDDACLRLLTADTGKSLLALSKQ
jgi:nucleoside-diphosphate-sugar epimerase